MIPQVFGSSCALKNSAALVGYGIRGAVEAPELLTVNPSYSLNRGRFDSNFAPRRPDRRGPTDALLFLCLCVSGSAHLPALRFGMRACAGRRAVSFSAVVSSDSRAKSLDLNNHIANSFLHPYNMVRMFARAYLAALMAAFVSGASDADASCGDPDLTPKQIKAPNDLSAGVAAWNKTWSD